MERRGVQSGDEFALRRSGEFRTECDTCSLSAQVVLFRLILPYLDPGVAWAWSATDDSVFTLLAIHRTAVSQLQIFSTEGFTPNDCAHPCILKLLQNWHNSGCIDGSLLFCSLNLQRRFGLTLHVQPNCPLR
jgi:hypothetical protein